MKIDADISTLRWFLTGGSPLPTELAEATERKTGKGVRNILGMTECAGAIAVEPVHAPRTPLSCGLRMPFSELAILGETDGDADPSKRLGPGETGIIAPARPERVGRVLPTRRGTPAPSCQAAGWSAATWVSSDAEGRLYVTGRKKDIIIRGAHNIDPQMIEDALLAHPDVETAAAVGMPDAYAGELPVAFVTLRAGATPDESALLDFLRDRIEDPVAVPKRIGVVDEMPLTPVGKIFKPALRREAIRWAILTATEGAEVEVAESLETRVTVPADRLDAVKEALSGMPLTLDIVARA